MIHAPFLIDIGVGIVAVFLIFSGLSFFHVGSLIGRSDANEYENNRSRTKSFMTGIRGDVPTKYDGTRDDRVAAGIAIDLKTNRWIEQGRLSDEALQDVLAP